MKYDWLGETQSKGKIKKIKVFNFTSIKILFIVGVIGLISCREKSSDKFRRVQLEDGGHAFTPYILNNGDTVLNGIAKYYDGSDNLVDEISFKNSQKNGWHLHYDSNLLVSKVFFENDSANGTGFFYSKNGKLQQEKLYEKEKKIMSRWFDENGKVESIAFYDNEIPFFVVAYSDSSQIFSRNGQLFSSDIKILPERITVNKPVVISIHTAVVPKFSTRIKIAKFDTRNEVYEVIDSVPISNFYAKLQTTFKTAGLQQIGIAGELKDHVGNIVKRDTLYKKVLVSE